MKKSADFFMLARAHERPSADPRDMSGREKLAAALRALRRACLQVFGIPDYERYLAHMTRDHPGEPVMSRAEFCARAIDHKYGGNGPRCC